MVRGIPLSLRLLGPLYAIAATRAHAIRHALGVINAANNGVAHARQIFDAAAANKNYGVLLQIMPDAGNISSNLHPVGQTYASDFAQSRVRFLGGHGCNLETH